jgi:hypothetical protein
MVQQRGYEQEYTYYGGNTPRYGIIDQAARCSRTPIGCLNRAATAFQPTAAALESAMYTHKEMLLQRLLLRRSKSKTRAIGWQCVGANQQCLA